MNLLRLLFIILLGAALSSCTGKGAGGNGNGQGYSGRRPDSIQGSAFYFLTPEGNGCSTDLSKSSYSVSIQFNEKNEVIAEDPCVGVQSKLSDYSESKTASVPQDNSSSIIATCQAPNPNSEVSEVSVFEEKGSGDFYVQMFQNIEGGQNTVRFKLAKDLAEQMKALNVPSETTKSSVILPIGVNSPQNQIDYTCNGIEKNLEDGGASNSPETSPQVPNLTNVPSPSPEVMSTPKMVDLIPTEMEIALEPQKPGSSVMVTRAYIKVRNIGLTDAVPQFPYRTAIKVGARELPAHFTAVRDAGRGASRGKIEPGGEGYIIAVLSQGLVSHCQRISVTIDLLDSTQEGVHLQVGPQGIFENDVATLQAIDLSKPLSICAQ